VCKQKEREYQERIDNSRREKKLSEADEEKVRNNLKQMKKA